MIKLFTVIIPCYNNSNLMTCCIDSVLSQTYPAVEIIICEDCGGNFDVGYYQKYIEATKSDNIIRQLVYSNPENYGTVKSLNYAIKKSKGEFIKIIAADDALASNESLEIVAKELEATQDECLLSDVLLCDEELNPVEIAKSDFLTEINNLTPKECFRRLCIRNRINAVGIFFKRSFFEHNGNFDEKYRLLEDWPTWLRLYSLGKKIHYFQYVATKRRMAVGVVAKNNPHFLADRRLVWSDIIKPNFKIVGLKLYIQSLIGAYLFTTPLLRKVYYKFRKGDAQ